VAHLPIALRRATVTAPHGTQQAAPTDGEASPPIGASRRRLSPAELHAQRVAWGKLWGARISQATRQWKGEL
jgi:hypothetical protein